jgi:competence protein ComEA
MTHLKTEILKLLNQDGREKNIMAERQKQYKLGLLQYHCSQQETTPSAAIRLSNILPRNVIPQTGALYTGPDARSREFYRAVPSHLDVTTYQAAVLTMPYPMLDQAILTTPYPTPDQAISTTSYPMPDQAISTKPYSMLNHEMPIMPDTELDQGTTIDAHAKKTRIVRLVAIAVVLISALAFYLIWRPTSSVSSPPVVTQQNSSGISYKGSSSKRGATTDATSDSSGDIQVYILGAVRHAGVYTLPSDARVYQLLQDAGGPLPNADLVTLNLAAKLNDGQEVYVLAIGESLPPGLSTANSGVGSTASSSSTPDASSTPSAQGQQLVNINTATEDEMKQQLHISSKTAETIINYRQQNGPFTSVSQLSGVVSKSIYDKIKNEVTV